MNHVSLIGKMESPPVIGELKGGICCSRFKLITQTKMIDAEGIPREVKQKHDVYAWGKWRHILNQVGQADLQMAVEGRLINRYVRWNGKTIKITEIEVNDVVLM
ncbi:MAG: single-stranded DNA-binding protein [Bacteroidetes bacterium]|nr:single-stranded DNA-binding protein [Bacteroidota bacterium]